MKAKDIKKFVLCLLAAVILTGGAACGNDNNADNNGDNNRHNNRHNNTAYETIMLTKKSNRGHQ